MLGSGEAALEQLVFSVKTTVDAWFFKSRASRDPVKVSSTNSISLPLSLNEHSFASKPNENRRGLGYIPPKQDKASGILMMEESARHTLATSGEQSEMQSDETLRRILRINDKKENPEPRLPQRYDNNRGSGIKRCANKNSSPNKRREEMEEEEESRSSAILKTTKNKCKIQSN